MFLGKFPDVRIKLVHQGFHCFPCCPEVGKINECLNLLERRISVPVEVLTGVFSNASPTIGSITWWRQLRKLLPDGKYLMLSYQNLMLKSGFQCRTLLNIREQQMHDLNLLKEKISRLWEMVAHW